MATKENDFEVASLDDFELKYVLDDVDEKDVCCDPVQADIVKRHKEYMAKRKKDLEAAGFKDGKLFTSKPFTGLEENFVLKENLFEAANSSPAKKNITRKYGDIEIEYDGRLSGWVFPGCDTVFKTLTDARRYIDSHDINEVENAKEEGILKNLQRSH